MKTFPNDMLARSFSILGGTLQFLGLGTLAVSEIGIASMSMIGLSLSFIGTATMAFGLYLLIKSGRETRSFLDDVRRAADSLASGRGDAETAAVPELAGIAQLHGEIITFADRITRGDLTATIEPRGPKDRLGKSMSEMSIAIRKRIGEMEKHQINGSALDDLKQFAHAAAKGDLTALLEDGRSLPAEVAAVIAEVARGLSERLRSAQEAAVKVRAATASLSSVAGEMAGHSDKRTRDTTDSAGSIAGIARQAGSFFDSVKNAAEPVSKCARTGATTVESARENVAAMRQIRNHVQESVKRTKRIGERSQELSRMVSDFEELADRASLLSLNSSLRSGRQSVDGPVSGSAEVQQIAERTTRLTDQIAQLIRSLSIEAKEASAALEDVIREVILASSIAEKVGRSVHELNVGIEASNTDLESIVSTAEQHAKSYESLSRSVAGIAAGDQAHQNSTRQAMDAVRELQSSTEQLDNALRFFKLPQPSQRIPSKALENDRFVN